MAHNDNDLIFENYVSFCYYSKEYVEDKIWRGKYMVPRNELNMNNFNSILFELRNNDL